MNETYDLAVIGGGSAGLTAVSFAVQLGARVALVEKNHIGGDCTWYGCVPSKTLLKTAKVAHQMRTAESYGLTPVEPKVDLKSVMGHVRSVIDTIYQHESPEALRAQGIDVFLDSACFIDHYTLSVGSEKITAHNILLATGAYPFIPPISGLDSVDYLTYENIWGLEILPEHLLVLGGGPIGCEMAQAFRRLGAQVTLVEGESRLLPREEMEASQLLAEVFEGEGLKLRLDAKAERVWQDEKGIHIKAGSTEILGDALLVAIGRRPSVDQFTHYAGWQAFMAVRHALLPGASKGVAEHGPWATFTDPEIAHVGLTEPQARDKFGDAVMHHRRLSFSTTDFWTG